MKNLWFIVGVAFILVGIIDLLLSALQRHGYVHLLDGDADRYSRLRRRMIRFFVMGIVLVMIGVLCIIIGR